MNTHDIRFEVRSITGRYPKLYFALLYLMHSPRRHLAVSRDTEIVIEGYPRSANTFAVAAFLTAQGRPVKIAHHIHLPAQVIQAVYWKIPTLVLIRQPKDAVLSLLVREPRLSAKQALWDYVRFYSTIRPYRSGFMLATFEQITRDFGEVTDRLNSKFGTHFLHFEHTEENLEKVYQIIEEMDKVDRGKSQVTETTVARPSEVREVLKEQKRRELEQPEIAALLKRARSVYQEIENCR